MRENVRQAITAAMLAAAVLLALQPATTSAGTLSHDGTRYLFDGAPGESNDLRVFYGTDSFGPYIEFDDSNAIFDGGGLGTMCASGGDSTVVRCDQALNPLIHLGDELDNFGGDPTAGTPEEVYGGPGNDRLVGWGGDDLLDGGPGDDQFEKGSPSVRNGNDVIVGGDGADEMYYRGDYGGAGPDPVTVSLDGAAGDGPAGQSDNVQVEAVFGGEADDVLRGGPGADRLIGDRGADEIHGEAGNDFLDGDVGDDRIFGGDGDDELRGGDSSADLLDGGSGSDNFIADGPCFFFGCDSGGNDRIQARDGFPDTINCGGGVDTAIVDQLDLFAQGGGFCEAVDRPPPCCNSGPLPDPDFELRAPRSVRWKALARRGLLVRIECAGQCAIDAALYASAVRVGRGRGFLEDAGKARVRVKLTRKAKRRLSHVRRLSLTLRVNIKSPGGAKAATSRMVRVRR
jgi:Ca2+-binding RTX toxin-like protein